jgi:hypothetical protein
LIEQLDEDNYRAVYGCLDHRDRVGALRMLNFTQE